MTDSHDLWEEMAQFPSAQDAERLLGWNEAPGGSSGEGFELTRLFAAMRAPGVAYDPAIEQRVVLGIAAEIRKSRAMPTTAARPRRHRRRVSTRAAGFAFVAMLASGSAVAAAATGSLPRGVQQAVANALAHVDISVPHPGHHAKPHPHVVTPATGHGHTTSTARGHGDALSGGSGSPHHSTNNGHEPASGTTPVTGPHRPHPTTPTGVGSGPPKTTPTNGNGNGNGKGTGNGNTTHTTPVPAGNGNGDGNGNANGKGVGNGRGHTTTTTTATTTTGTGNGNGNKTRVTPVTQVTPGTGNGRKPA